jgi:G3E family GTPase
MWSSVRAQIDAHRSDDSISHAPCASLKPVALLTGFLGAGKSTLLVHLLQNPQGLRIRAIVNDVGSLPFDPTLVGMEDDVRVELTNGCGCCATTTDIARALDDLARVDDCDLIVLEASGAADPRVLAHVIAANPLLTLNRVVTVVAARTLLNGQHAVSFDVNFERQIAIANNIVVSGCDELTNDEMEDARQQASSRAPGRTVHMSGVHDPASGVLTPEAVRGAYPMVDDSPNQHSTLHVSTVNATRLVSMNDLHRALERTRPGIVRVKGHLNIDGQIMSVQATAQSVVIGEAPGGAHGITFIGTDSASVDDLVQLVSS